MNVFTVTTPLVTVGVTTDREAVIEIHLNDDPGGRPASDFDQSVAEEMLAYAQGTRRAFSFAINPTGSPFQLKSWQALRAIPFGETRSYGDIARAIGQPGASRAVGMANHHNRLPLVIPCHRVVATGGDLGGFAGGVELKRRLLEHEGALDAHHQFSLL